MKDGPLRRALKAVARWKYSFELTVTRAIQRRRGTIRFELGGDCRRCAKCCEAPSVRTGRAIWTLPTLRRLFLAWQERVNGFDLVGEDEARRTFTFRCTHFDWETRRCDSYATRPGICRDYPRGLLAQPKPDFFPECGYRPLDPNAAGLLGALMKSRRSR